MDDLQEKWEEVRQNILGRLSLPAQTRDNSSMTFTADDLLPLPTTWIGDDCCWQGLPGEFYVLHPTLKNRVDCSSRQDAERVLRALRELSNAQT